MLALVVLVACDSGTPVKTSPVVVASPPPHTVMLTFGRSACYGPCPIYSITVYRDGSLEYHGDRFVKKIGDASGTLTLTQIAAIDQLFASHDVPNRDFVHEDATDNPSTEFAYTAPSGKKLAVHHYHGDDSAPKVLGEVEEGIDSIVKIDVFIGTRSEREAAQYYR